MRESRQISSVPAKHTMSTYSDGKAGGHSVEVVRMCPHCHDLWNDGFISPLDTKDFSELFKVMCCSFTNGEDRVAQPSHAEGG